MIILRCHVFGDRERTLMGRLQEVRTHALAVAADETRGHLDVGPYDKIAVTRDACRRLGLFCPNDFTWRNGDYVFYLARQRYPHENHFWMIESDVEHSFPSDAALFDLFDAHPKFDLLTSYLRASTEGWWWRQTGRPRSTGVKRGLFCFIRLSARAIDLCLHERQRGRFALRDRLDWPNDEVFVTTEIIHAGLPAADLNEFGQQVYTLDTFSYDRPVDGATIDLRGFLNMLYHPVLYGDAYGHRIGRLHAAGIGSSLPQKIRRRLQRLLR